MHLLLLEADPARQSRLAGWLASWGHSVTPLDSADDLCPTLRRDPSIHLALLDGDLHELRIDRVTELIEQLDRPQPLSIMMMVSPSNLPSDAASLGANDLLTKPVESAVLQQRMEVFAAYHQAHRQLAELHRTAPMALIILDELNQVVSMNNAGALLTGHSPEAASEHHYAMILGCIHALPNGGGCGKGPICQGCQLRLALLEIRKTGKDVWRLPVVVFRKNGAKSIELHLLITSGQVDTPKGRQTLLFLEDLSDQKRIETDLRSTVAELEAFNRVAIGRELRMIELKRQINDYAQRLEEPPPYDLRFAEHRAQSIETLSEQHSDGDESPIKLS
jgi:CheY-like chemotaxis protein